MFSTAQSPSLVTPVSNVIYPYCQRHMTLTSSNSTNKQLLYKTYDIQVTDKIMKYKHRGVSTTLPHLRKLMF